MIRKNPKFDLKMKYQRIFEIGIILSISLIILAFRFFPKIDIQNYIPVEEQPLITSIWVPETGKPEVPKPPVPKILIDEELVDDEMEDVVIETTEVDPSNALEANPTYYNNEEIDEQPPFYAVETMPELIGGIASLQKSIVYPELSLRAGIQGKVIVQAVVNKNGNVEDIIIVKSLDPGCDEAAIEAVKKAKFNPGLQRGKPVKVYVYIPIVFKLN